MQVGQRGAAHLDRIGLDANCSILLACRARMPPVEAGRHDQRAMPIWGDRQLTTREGLGSRSMSNQTNAPRMKIRD